MTKKIPISFNEDDEGKVKELIDLLGLSGSYGDFPKAVKFSITLALSTIKNPEKVYNGLDDENLSLYFSSIQKFEKRHRLERKAEELKEMAQKV